MQLALLNCVGWCLLLLLPLASFSSLNTDEKDKKGQEVDSGNTSKAPKSLIKLAPSAITVHDIALQVIQWSPQLQDKYRFTARMEKAMISLRSPYQSLLAENLLLPGLARLPLHTDLKVFEGIKFEPTPEGKVAALTFAYSMVSKIPLFDAVFGVILDEASILAANNPAEFEKFLLLSGFHKETDRTSNFLSHFLKKEDLSGWAHLMTACPELTSSLKYWSCCTHFSDFCSPQKLSSLTEISKYLTQHPQHISLFLGTFDNSVFKLLYLIYSELPIEQVIGVFHDKLLLLSVSGILDASASLLNLPIVSALPDLERFLTRLKEFLLDVHQLFREILTVDQTNCLALFIKIYFESYEFKEADVKDATVYNQELIGTHLSMILIVAKRYREALHFLPKAPDFHFSMYIHKYPEFCSLLARERPEWIKKQYQYNQEFRFKNPDIAMAYYGLDVMDDLINQVSDVHEARYFYRHGSLHSIETMLSRLTSYGLFIGHFDAFLSFQRYATEDEAMDPERFVKILWAFLNRHQLPEGWTNANGISIQFCFSVKNFIGILEFGGEEMLRVLESQPFCCKFILKTDVFLKILNSDELRPKLFAHKSTFKRVFQQEILNLVKNCRSPLEIYYGLMLTDLDRRVWVDGALIESLKLFRERFLRRVDLNTILIAVGRILEVENSTEKRNISLIRCWLNSVWKQLRCPST